jgi:hypothetical protein
MQSARLVFIESHHACVVLRPAHGPEPPGGQLGIDVGTDRTLRFALFDDFDKEIHVGLVLGFQFPPQVLLGRRSQELVPGVEEVGLRRTMEPGGLAQELRCVGAVETVEDGGRALVYKVEGRQQHLAPAGELLVQSFLRDPFGCGYAGRGGSTQPVLRHELRGGFRDASASCLSGHAPVRLDLGGVVGRVHPPAPQETVFVVQS